MTPLKAEERGKVSQEEVPAPEAVAGEAVADAEDPEEAAEAEAVGAVKCSVLVLSPKFVITFSI